MHLLNKIDKILLMDTKYIYILLTGNVITKSICYIDNIIIIYIYI